MKWIDAKKQKPTAWATVIVCDNHGNVMAGYWVERDRWGTYPFPADGTIVKWQPLPKAVVGQKEKPK